MLNVAMITSWNVRCGIAEYSRNLVYGLQELDDVDVRVFANFSKSPVRTDEDFVTKTFWVEAWDHESGADNSTFLSIDFDVLHFQIQATLYKQEWLQETLYLAKRLGLMTVGTFHDNCVWGTFDFKNLDITIAHKDQVLKSLPERSRVLVPMGLPYVPVRLCSFGLGRSENKKIADICEELGFEFVVSDSDKEWLTQTELLRFVRSCDGTVLWYPESGGTGSSSAARMAIAARRPLFTSATSWFNDIDGEKNVFQFADLDAFKQCLKDFYSHRLIDNYNWNKVADIHRNLYVG